MFLCTLPLCLAYYFYSAAAPSGSRSHVDTPHSVGLLWTGDKLDAEVFTWQYTTLAIDIQDVRKRLDTFFYFPRCPVCGEWCKLHWVLLDIPSFDWNTRRSHGYKIFKMAPTKQQNFFKKVQSFSDTLYISMPSVGFEPAVPASQNASGRRPAPFTAQLWGRRLP